MFNEYIAIDTETNTISGETPQVIEIGLVYVRNEAIVLEYCQLIKPKSPLSPISKKITNISQEELNEAPTMEETLPILSLIIGNKPLVGHSIQYDLAALKETGLDLTAHEVADTMVLSQSKWPLEPHHSLSDVCERLGITNQNPHRALSDAKATSMCYMKLASEESGLLLKLRRTACKALYNYWDCTELNDLSKSTIVVTGIPTCVPDKIDLENIVLATGATLKNSVSRKVNYLIVCDNLDQRTNGELSTKHLKALELIEKGVDIRIITEAEFLQMAGFVKKN